MAAVTTENAGPVLGQNLLDAESGGCGMLMEKLRPWMDKCVRSQQLDILITVVVSPTPCTRVDRYRAPTPISCSVGGRGIGVRGFVVLGCCGTRVRSSVCRTTLTVNNRLKGAGSGKYLGPCGNVTFPPLPAMEETLHGTIWNMIGPLLTTEDVVRCRTVAKRWNVGSRYGEMGEMFFLSLHNDPFAKHRYFDSEGNKACMMLKKRIPILEVPESGSFTGRGLLCRRGGVFLGC